MANKPSARKRANAKEQGIGMQGTTAEGMAKAYDFFTNIAARTGFGTPSLTEGTQYELVRLSFNYWELITLYRNHWIARKVVDIPAQDMVRAWPKLTSEIDPDDVSAIDKVLRRTGTKANFLRALQWARLFGGSGALIVVKGDEDKLDEPIDLDKIEIGSYSGLIPFDRWAGITPSEEICNDITRPLEFNKPEFYDVRIPGGEQFRVHASRILRFTGPPVPTPEYEAQTWWGISVIEPVYEELRKRDNLSWNILSLSFRANILGMKFPSLAEILSGVGANQKQNMKFQQQMTEINHLMSNQSLVPLPKDGGLESAQYSFAGLSEVYQQFQLDISGASNIPVVRLWGRTITGLGQSNDADERIYEEKIAADQDQDMRPQLEQLYPVICMSELGEVPEDLDLIFPSVRVLDEKEKSELAKSVVDTVTVALNSGLISPRTAAEELKQSSDITGVFTNITAKEIKKLSNDVQDPGEMGEGLFGAEGAETLDPAGSPKQALKESDKLDAGKKKPAKKKAPKDKGKEKKGKKPKAKAKDGLEPFEEESEAEDELVDDEPLEPRVHVPAMDSVSLVIVPSETKAGLEIHFAGCKHVPASVLKRNKPFQADPKTALKEERAAHPGIPVSLASCIKSHATDSAAGARRNMTLYHAMPVTIETPRGGVRKGKGWRVTLPADYGYIDGYKGADGDEVDCYVGPSPESLNVYVVDQKTLNGKQFDEHKVMFGYHTKESALEDYMEGHSASSMVFGAITELTMPMFRRWLKEGDLTRSYSADWGRARDAVNFKEAEHPRDNSGKFSETAGGGAATKMPKGMEHITKGAHKTVGSFCSSLVGESKFSNEDIAKAAQVQFGSKTSAASVAWYKMKLKQSTPEGKAAKAAKAAGVKANNTTIAKTDTSPKAAAAADKTLTQQEKKGYKILYVKGYSDTGSLVHMKLDSVPDGVDSVNGLEPIANKLGLKSVSLVLPWNPSKPVPEKLKEASLSDEDANAAKDAKYAKAKAEADANKPFTDLDEELSTSMQQAIKHYTDGSYQHVNKALRNGQPLTPEHAVLAAELDKVMSKSKTTEDITVYRGIASPAKFFGPDPKIGMTIVDNGFISTSKSKGTANGFGSQMQAHIKIRKGSRAIDVAKLSLHPSEKEVILPRGTMFKITAIKGKVVECEYV